ncbi:MarR family winged helix-turn-helix transcriptional regulator [Kineosporia succinea]|uniref:DNA-binding MarR family transcriptional regulator n=1 Tax=Kineosporia succinea TaxID=84632 RepID=A0ABT9PAW2_9ACTN|nr:MarR family transcriptional regulator [Kineosporia succinea]MDP9829836.1 DNA-binding MarR family transcriptional regulator [Kineosporia succinea]
MGTPPSVDSDLARIQESIAWLIRLGEFHRFHRGEAGDGPMLDRTAFLLLSSLTDGATLTMGEIAERLDITPSTATRRVAPLADAGLVRRDRRPDAHRTVFITLTDAGRARVEAVREARVETLRQTFRDWRADELATLASTIDRLTRTLAVELTQDDDFADRHVRPGPDGVTGARQ